MYVTLNTINGVMEDWRRWLLSSVGNGTHSGREERETRGWGGGCGLGSKEIEEAIAIISSPPNPRVEEDGHSLGEIQPKHFVCLEYI